ncbi:MAG TPA: hypothetical protein VN634_15015 [Candidatus Limnocylindrales bacterium]|nr:hypothetical protein [Candidatus Limnocylindrales bacterium]
MTDFERWLSGQRLGDAKMSSVLKAQLEKFLFEGPLNPFPILEEIRLLEGIDEETSRTGPSREFAIGPLAGLMYKHFVNARFIAKNVQSHWTDKKLLKMMGGKVSQAGPVDDDAERAWKLAGEIAREYVLGAYGKREKSHSLTGEWLIYKRLGSTNYYLTCAGHDEDQQEIHGRILRGAAADFPELELS